MVAYTIVMLSKKFGLPNLLCCCTNKHLELARLEVQPAFTYVMQYIIAQDYKAIRAVTGQCKRNRWPRQLETYMSKLQAYLLCMLHAGFMVSGLLSIS